VCVCSQNPPAHRIHHDTKHLAHSSLPNMAGSEPFPLLNTANDQFSTSQDANGNAARRRRKSSGLPGELRGDTGAPSLGTSPAHMSALNGHHARVSKPPPPFNPATGAILLRPMAQRTRNPPLLVAPSYTPYMRSR
jgi:hypothetical protein